MADFATLLIEQNADWVKVLTLQNDDGSVINLTGCQAHMQVRAFIGSPVVLLDLSTVAGNMTINGPAGQISWDIPASQTLALQPSPGVVPGLTQPGTALLGYYDLLVKYASGEIVSYLSGQVLLKLCVTNPF